MKKELLYLIITGLIISLAISLANARGLSQDLQKIEDRALQTQPQDCYQWQDLEVIIFGEIQE